jgi:hypothetical protein
MSTYSYAPLSKSLVRLFPLESHAHALGSPIRCQLVCVEISTAHYQALSYCWGDTSEKKDILIGDKVMAVSSNMWSALDHLRGCNCSICGLENGLRGTSTKHSSSRYLWVDALGINQNDIQERNHEVSRMGEIYRKAQLVITWLGAEDPYTNLALTIHKSIVFDGFMEDFIGQESAQIDALEAFAQHPYFSSMWVIQEVILAREVVISCGQNSVSWSQLSRFLEVVEAVHLRSRSIGDDVSRVPSLFDRSPAMLFHQNRKTWQA